jgi:hypothetical protein
LIRRTTAVLLAAACLAALSSSVLVAGAPARQIAVIVKAAVGDSPADRFQVVGTDRTVVVSDLGKVLRKSFNPLAPRQFGDPLPVTIQVGVTYVCETTEAGLDPGRGSASKLVWVVDAEYAIVSTDAGAETKPARNLRSFRGTGRDRAAAVDMVAKDLIAFVAANRSALLAGK